MNVGGQQRTVARIAGRAPDKAPKPQAPATDQPPAQPADADATTRA